jgi:hypothetical protein
MAEIWKSLSLDTYKCWAQAILDEHDISNKLTDWELNFVTDIKDQLETGFALSRRQAEVLERIYAQKTP